MTMRKTIPLCWWCRHFHAETYERAYAYQCDVFREGIPAEIVNGEYDHRAAHPDDDGVAFQKAAITEITPRLMFRTHNEEAVETWWIEVQFLLEMGRMRGGIQPPLEE